MVESHREASPQYPWWDGEGDEGEGGGEGNEGGIVLYLMEPWGGDT